MMWSEPKNRISKRALSVWRIHGIIYTAAMAILFIIIAALFFTFDWPKWLLAVLAVLVFIDCLFNIFLKPKLRWRRWRYEVRDEEIEIQHGLFVIRKTLIPMVRVQHVDLEQGPILKKYRLATVRVHTAATPHAIPALEGEEADRLRSTIAQLAKVALDDV